MTALTGTLSACLARHHVSIAMEPTAPKAAAGDAIARSSMNARWTALYRQRITLGDRHLIRQSAISFGTRVTGLVFALSASVLLSRLLGLSGFGAYMIALGYASIASIVIRFGFDLAGQRFAAVYLDQARTGHLRGFVATGMTAIVLGWLVMAASLFFAWESGWSAIRSLSPLLVASAVALSLLMALTGFLSVLLRVFDRVFESQLYEQLLRPLLLILFLCGAMLIGVTLAPDRAMMLTVAGLGLPLVMMLIRVRNLIRNLPPQDREMSDRSTWVRVGLVLLLMAVLQEVLNQIDLILLGMLGNNAEAGLLAAAQRLSALSVFGLAAIAAVAGPRIAAAFHRGDHAEVAAIARLSARISFASAVAIGGILALAGPWILAVWGSEFTTAMPLLLVLLLGAMVNAATGLAGLLVILTGHERVAMICVGATLVVVVAAELVLIPAYGAMGAAIGSALGLSMWNGLLTIYVRRRLGIDCTVFGLRPRQPATPLVA